MHVSDSVRPERGVRPEDLLRHLTAFTARGDTWRTPLLPDEVVVTADPPPTRNVVKDVLTRAVHEVSSDSGPTIPLSNSSPRSTPIRGGTRWPTGSRL